MNMQVGSRSVNAFVLIAWLTLATIKLLISAKSDENVCYFSALLEKPIVPSPWNPGEFSYKIFISGRSGVGKTSTAAKLSANPVPQSHSETPGE